MEEPIKWNLQRTETKASLHSMVNAFLDRIPYAKPAYSSYSWRAVCSRTSQFVWTTISIVSYQLFYSPPSFPGQITEFDHSIIWIRQKTLFRRGRFNKNRKQKRQTYRSKWNGSRWAVSSGSTLFVNTSNLIRRFERTRSLHSPAD